MMAVGQTITQDTSFKLNPDIYFERSVTIDNGLERIIAVCDSAKNCKIRYDEKSYPISYPNFLIVKMIHLSSQISYKNTGHQIVFEIK
jgi:hypothetical protein